MDGVLVDDFTVLKGVAFFVGDVPAQGFEERIEELAEAQKRTEEKLLDNFRYGQGFPPVVVCG